MAYVQSTHSAQCRPPRPSAAIQRRPTVLWKHHERGGRHAAQGVRSAIQPSQVGHFSSGLITSQATKMTIGLSVPAEVCVDGGSAVASAVGAIREVRRLWLLRPEIPPPRRPSPLSGAGRRLTRRPTEYVLQALPRRSKVDCGRSSRITDSLAGRQHPDGRRSLPSGRPLMDRFSYPIRHSASNCCRRSAIHLDFAFHLTFAFDEGLRIVATSVRFHVKHHRSCFT